jgi:peptidoglycan/xylan/chitin deacetylase (PgdA/CDA1 family)
MACGPWIMHRVSRASQVRFSINIAIIVIASSGGFSWAAGQKPCENPVYLTLDTGHMAVAPLMADVLKRNDVRVTFFAANERTQEGDGSLGQYWAPWWKARAAEGHEFASHTYDHVYWRADLPGVAPAFRVRPSAGALAGREFTWSAEWAIHLAPQSGK